MGHHSEHHTQHISFSETTPTGVPLCDTTP
jgi:hypothetical protein